MSYSMGSRMFKIGCRTLMKVPTAPESIRTEAVFPLSPILEEIMAYSLAIKGICKADLVVSSL